MCPISVVELQIKWHKWSHNVQVCLCVTWPFQHKDLSKGEKCWVIPLTSTGTQGIRCTQSLGTVPAAYLALWECSYSDTPIVPMGHFGLAGAGLKYVKVAKRDRIQLYIHASKHVFFLPPPSSMSSLSRNSSVPFPSQHILPTAHPTATLSSVSGQSVAWPPACAHDCPWLCWQLQCQNVQHLQDQGTSAWILPAVLI